MDRDPIEIEGAGLIRSRAFALPLPLWQRAYFSLAFLLAVIAVAGLLLMRGA